MSGYVIGDKVTILGTQLGGTSPSNDLILIADGADFSSVSVVSGTPAAASVLNLICTFTMTEATTASMPANTSISFEALATLEYWLGLSLTG